MLINDVSIKINSLKYLPSHASPRLLPSTRHHYVMYIGLAWLGFLYNFLLSNFSFIPFLSKSAAKLLFFERRVVVVFTTFDIDLQLSAEFVPLKGKNGSRSPRTHP